MIDLQPFHPGDRVFHETWGLYGTVQVCAQSGITWFCKTTFDDRPATEKLVAASLLTMAVRRSGIRVVVSNPAIPRAGGLPQPHDRALPSPVTARSPASSQPDQYPPGPATGPASHPESPA